MIDCATCNELFEREPGTYRCPECGSVVGVRAESYSAEEDDE